MPVRFQEPPAIDGLLDDATWEAAARVEGFVQQALALRREADDLGGQGQFEAAIGKLEASTKELIKAIRSAGLYIPG